MPSENSHDPNPVTVSPGLLELQEAGWLSRFHSHRYRRTLLEALSCPDCGSDEVWVTEDDRDGMVELLCGDCRNKHVVSQLRLAERQAPEQGVDDGE